MDGYDARQINALIEMLEIRLYDPPKFGDLLFFDLDGIPVHQAYLLGQRAKIALWNRIYATVFGASGHTSTFGRTHDKG